MNSPYRPKREVIGLTTMLNRLLTLSHTGDISLNALISYLLGLRRTQTPLLKEIRLILGPSGPLREINQTAQEILIAK